jgi:hypothetical protein
VVENSSFLGPGLKSEKRLRDWNPAHALFHRKHSDQDIQVSKK